MPDRMPSHRERVDVGGAELLTARTGHGPPMIVAHGGPGLWSNLRPVAEMVDDMCTVHLYDQRACGESSGGPPHSLDRAIADLEALREHWGYDRWIVGGHSFGANLALAYAVAHPDRTRAVVSLAGTGVTLAWRPEYKREQRHRLSAEQRAELSRVMLALPGAEGDEWRALDMQMRRLLWQVEFADRSAAPALVEELLLEGLYPNYEVNRALSADWRRWIETGMPAKLSAVSAPVLLVAGASDPRGSWPVEELAGLLPNARLAVLPGVGHQMWMERPELIREELRSFVSAVLV